MEQNSTLMFPGGRYNTLMHFLNVVECYWQNPDLNNVQVFGKDIRALIATSCVCTIKITILGLKVTIFYSKNDDFVMKRCQKVFFEEGHSWYHYGPLEQPHLCEMDLAVATSLGHVVRFCITMMILEWFYNKYDGL